MKKLAFLIAVPLAAGIPFAVTSAGAASAASGGAVASSGTVVKTAHTKLGTVLVGPNGHTLYLFELDKGTTSHCSGTCAAGWPPLTTSGSPHASGGASASKLGTTTRSGGVKQVTYNGHPLYYFVGDTAAGQTKGEGLKAFGASWYVLSPSGSKIDKS
jgi:predicted lipoprotein with Yx(FWY)xxD motif